MAELANAYITITPRVDFAPVAGMLRELADRLDEMQERFNGTMRDEFPHEFPHKSTPKVIKHFELPKKGNPLVDGEEFPYYVSADFPVDTTTREGVTFVTLTLLADKVTIGGEVVE